MPSSTIFSRAAAVAARSARSTSWNCRASALYTSIDGNNRVEPIVANGLTSGELDLSIKKLVRDAPSIDTDGELLAQDEPAVFTHYELPYDAGDTERLLARR